MFKRAWLGTEDTFWNHDVTNVDMSVEVSQNRKTRICKTNMAGNKDTFWNRDFKNVDMSLELWQK